MLQSLFDHIKSSERPMIFENMAETLLIVNLIFATDAMAEKPICILESLANRSTDLLIST